MQFSEKCEHCKITSIIFKYKINYSSNVNKVREQLVQARFASYQILANEYAWNVLSEITSLFDVSQVYTPRSFETVAKKDSAVQKVVQRAHREKLIAISRYEPTKSCIGV